MEHVLDLLTKKGPQFNIVSSTCRVSDALYRMCCEAIDFLIVQENDRFMGIISDHDIASRILFEDRPLKDIPVREFMNTTLPVSTPDASLQNCMQLMERFHSRHVAVYDSFEFKGVLSSYELMQEAALCPQGVFAGEEEPRRGSRWDY